MTEAQATEMIDWLKSLFMLQLAVGGAVLVVLTALAVVFFWRGA